MTERTTSNATPPVPEDVLEAIAALPDARREALIDWLRGALGRMNRPASTRRPHRRPAILGIGEQPTDTQEANPAWLGRIEFPDETPGGNAT